MGQQICVTARSPLGGEYAQQWWCWSHAESLDFARDIQGGVKHLLGVNQADIYMLSKCSLYEILTKSISRKFLEYSDAVDSVSIANDIALPSFLTRSCLKPSVWTLIHDPSLRLRSHLQQRSPNRCSQRINALESLYSQRQEPSDTLPQPHPHVASNRQPRTATALSTSMLAHPGYQEVGQIVSEINQLDRVTVMVVPVGWNRIAITKYFWVQKFQ